MFACVKKEKMHAVKPHAARLSDSAYGTDKSYSTYGAAVE